MSQHDPSLHPDARYGSRLWAAQRLGMSKDTFFKRRSALEAEGFPKIDPLTNLYVKDDVDAWIDRRRRISDDAKVSTPATEPRLDQL